MRCIESFDVRPAGAVYDATDVAATYAKVKSNSCVRLAKFRARSDLSYHGICQSSVMVFFAFLAAVLTHVSHVASPRIPSKVGHIVVAGIAINVARLLTISAIANESFKNKMMDIAANFAAKRDGKAIVVIAGGVTTPGLQLAPFSADAPFAVALCPYGSIRANTIARQASNIAVDSHAYVFSVMGRIFKTERRQLCDT